MKLLRPWTFSWQEVGVLKAYCVAAGILLAHYFGDFFAQFVWLWWTIVILGAVYWISWLFKNCQHPTNSEV